MARVVLRGLDGVKAAVGCQLGYNDWLEATQDLVDRFGDPTGDQSGFPKPASGL